MTSAARPSTRRSRTPCRAQGSHGRRSASAAPTPPGSTPSWATARCGRSLITWTRRFSASTATEPAARRSCCPKRTNGTLIISGNDERPFLNPALRPAEEGTSPRERPPEFGDVELLHLHQGRHGPRGAFRPRLAQHLGHAARHHLPRHAEPVLQPPALLGLRVAALRQLRPVEIDLLLR